MAQKCHLKNEAKLKIKVRKPNTGVLIETIGGPRVISATGLREVK